MSVSFQHTVLPPQRESNVREVCAVLERTVTVSVVAGGDRVELPEEVVTVLREVIRAMADGQAITVAPREQMLTTQEAADFLGVSRPTLVQLLTNGQIPFTRPNRHRRVRLSDLLEYQDTSRQQRRVLLDEMTREAHTDSPAGDGFQTTR